MIPPDNATGAVLVGALFKTGQLVAPLPHQRVKSDQLGLKLRRLSRFTMRYHESEALG